MGESIERWRYVLGGMKGPATDTIPLSGSVAVGGHR